APGLGTLAEGLLDVAMLLLLSGPALYWRFMAALRRQPVRFQGLSSGYRKPRLAVGLAALTQILGLLLTAAGVWWQGSNLDSLSQSRFVQGAQHIQTEVVRRLNQSVYGLRGARGAMAASARFKRAEFRAYVESRDLPTEFPGIRGFGLIQRVQRSQLERFVAGERADGASDFAVRTQGNAADLLVVKYVEPLANNRDALGIDLGQESLRRAAIEYAVATGQPTLLAGIELLQDSQRSPGFMYFLPLYRQDSKAETPAQRQHDLLGILYAPIVASELLGSVAASTDHLIDFELFDGPGTERSKLIFDADGVLSSTHAVGRSSGASQRNFVQEQVLNVGSRVLTLRTSSTPRFDAAQDRSSLVIIGLGGTPVSFLMAISVWLLAVGRQRARELADSMNAELDRMAQVVQHTDNAVTIMNRDMRIRWVNRGFTQITGYSLDEAWDKTPGELLSSGKSDAEAIQTLLDGAQSGVACRVELINRAKDGREYWADTEVQPTLDAQGQLVGFMEIGTDITLQKQTQHQLEAAMRDARALLDTVEMHAIVSSTDAAGTITDVNDAFCQLSGYSREELIGQNHKLLHSQVHSPAFWANLWQTISSGKPWRGEICNQAKDGTLYWVDSMIAPFVGENGEIEKYVAIRTDITARHQSAERLRQSEATFSASFYNAASGIGFLSPKGQWLRANPALCDFLGYTELELHELTLHDTNHPDEWDTDRLQIRRLLDGEIAVYQRAKRYLHRDGSTVWGLASISVVRSENDVPQFVISQIVDITARKRAEEALRLSNALMEETQAVAGVGGWELNLASGHLYWTSETYRILETSPDEFDPSVDGSIGFFLPDSRERLQQAMRRARHEGAGFDLELETLTTKGRQIHVRTTGSPTLENGAVVRLSGIFQDITERTQYERSLHEAREKAEQATRSKAQFLANMSHEIRTPMNAILGMLKLLHNTELSSRQRDYASKSESAAKSLLGLINDILDFSKVEAGKMQLDPQPFALDTLMRDLAVILSSNVASGQVEVLYDIDPAVPPVLLGDSMRLQQVLINLGGNAVKFTARGQVVVSVRLQQLEGAQAALEFAVQDTGIGIAPEHQAHIFTGFSQAEASTTRRFGGTGLGLSISHRLVDLMGGTLRVRSALGEGSTFFFTVQLPVVAAAPAELQRPAPSAGPARRALVVDANPVAQRLLADMVRSLGWSAQVADSGEAALLALAQPGQASVDVVFMAWQMPGLDGWAATAQLRQLCSARQAPQPVVVMLSASGREALDQRTQQEQALLNGFLVKPVTASMLRDAALQASATGSGMRRGPRSGASQRRLQGMRILVVEDNLINQQVAEELLMTEGAVVALAANGRLGVEAIAAAERGRQFDVVLMDLQMPVLDGFAATRMVREDLHLDALPIVAMTANAQQSDREECLAAGMNEHVGKPFDLKQLVQTLLQVTGFVPQPDARFGLAAPAAVAVPQGPPPVAQQDVAAAIQRMGGAHGLYQRLAREFMASLPEQLQQLQAALEHDRARCLLLAHTLKGTAATLGAVALANAAAALEHDSRHAMPAAQRLQAFNAVQTAAHAAQEMLQAQLDTAPPVPASDAALLPQGQLEPAALRRALQDLVQLLGANDLTALEQFATLRGALAHVVPALLEPLEDALQQLDLSAATQHCRAIAAWLEDEACSADAAAMLP
ncbi:MAG: PAS domain S-box protein, partial [Rhodoferax sp.]|nr:PAS domain S-box protein [Rhodoferax sp.]